MPDIEMFDNVDDMFAAINRRVETAKRLIRPRQAQITYDDYWMTIKPEWNLAIFGRVFTLDEIVDDETAAGSDPEEIEESLAMLKSGYENGFRFGVAFSIACPEGELGDTHVATMIPITKGEFLEASLYGWDWDRIKQLPWANLSSLMERIVEPTAKIGHSEELEYHDRDTQGYGDGLDDVWSCACGKEFGIRDLDEAYQHGKDVGNEAISG